MNKHVTFSRHSRRQFIRYGALAATGAVVTGPHLLRGQNLNSRLNLAQIGCAGKGGSDLVCCVAGGANVVALCDTNAKVLESVKPQFPELYRQVTRGRFTAPPNVNVYQDYRELLEKEKNLDAVDVATPDHMHAVIAGTAIKLGKHVYCQKPLTHDVFEARKLREMAKQYKVATQMGNQGSASDSLRRGVELVQAGLIGPVHEAYVWTNRPVWPQGLERPAGNDPVPAGLAWNLWLGTAPERPFKLSWPDGPHQGLFGPEVYQPNNWRGWFDFGTGALGDMACHTVNWPFRALKLGYPTLVVARSEGMTADMYPKNSRIDFEFPAREDMPAVTLRWSDGGLKPPAEVTADVEALAGKVSNSGCIMIGEKGFVFSPDDGDQDLRTLVKLKGDKELVLAQNHEAAKAIPQTLPRNEFRGSPDERQHREWLQACRDGKHDVPYSNFDIAAYLTEIILLGCVALRVRKKLEWDGPAMMAKNAPEAAAIVKRNYRPGWEI
jgi:predicted dehydrogenase